MVMDMPGGRNEISNIYIVLNVFICRFIHDRASFELKTNQPGVSIIDEQEINRDGSI